MSSSSHGLVSPPVKGGMTHLFIAELNETWLVLDDLISFIHAGFEQFW